jgi:D-3-phosphoglycerate dehydrogenase / 2-oxoglutarate reductase
LVSSRDRYTVLVTDFAWPSLDIERAALDKIGADLRVAEEGTENELIRIAPEADAILTNWKPVTGRVLDAAPNCLLVARYGVGLDNIDVQHATELGMLVTNVPDFCLDEVSDHAMALLLACARQVVTFARDTHNGTWNLKAGGSLHRLRGQTLGLVGYGNTARAMVPKALGFGLRVVAYSPNISPAMVASGVEVARSLGDLLGVSDFVSLHVPLTPETHGLIGEDALRAMKPTAYLINTSRGPIIDEDSMYTALTQGWIAGAALDVLSTEPPAPDHPLLNLGNIIITPHAAFSSVEAVNELQEKAVSRVVDTLSGRLPDCIINPSVMQQSNYRGPTP